MTATSTISDRACEILRRIRDDDLSPPQLKLIEDAVNGVLIATRVAQFNDLHDEVISGHYQTPCLHDIEHLTMDVGGYVYWKGQHVEHYSGSWCDSPKGKQQAMELARRCRYLERIDAEINCPNAVWLWDEKYAEAAGSWWR